MILVLGCLAPLMLGVVLVAMIRLIVNFKTHRPPALQVKTVYTVSLMPLLCYAILFLIDPQYMSAFFATGADSWQPMCALLGVMVVMLTMVSSAVMSAIVSEPRIHSILLVVPIVLFSLPAVVILAFGPAIPQIMQAY